MLRGHEIALQPSPTRVIAVTGQDEICAGCRPGPRPAWTALHKLVCNKPALSPSEKVAILMATLLVETATTHDDVIDVVVRMPQQTNTRSRVPK
jgi:hypothetical protein